MGLHLSSKLHRHRRIVVELAISPPGEHIRGKRQYGYRFEPFPAPVAFPGGSVWSVLLFLSSLCSVGMQPWVNVSVCWLAASFSTCLRIACPVAGHNKLKPKNGKR